MVEEVLENKKSGRDEQSILKLDWTKPEEIQRYTTETGKILPRRITGLTAKAQRHMTRIIKRARNMLLMK